MFTKNAKRTIAYASKHVPYYMITYSTMASHVPDAYELPTYLVKFRPCRASLRRYSTTFSRVALRKNADNLAGHIPNYT